MLTIFPTLGQHRLVKFLLQGKQIYVKPHGYARSTPGVGVHWQVHNLNTVDCKTVVFGRFRKAGSAVSVILEWRENDCRLFIQRIRSKEGPYNVHHSPSPFLHSFQTFRSNMIRRSRSQKIRLFCSLRASDYEIDPNRTLVYPKI